MLMGNLQELVGEKPSQNLPRYCNCPNAPPETVAACHALSLGLIVGTQVDEIDDALWLQPLG